jgi:hypothetical protein
MATRTDAQWKQACLPLGHGGRHTGAPASRPPQQVPLQRICGDRLWRLLLGPAAAFADHSTLCNPHPTMQVPQPASTLPTVFLRTLVLGRAPQHGTRTILAAAVTSPHLLWFRAALAKGALAPSHPLGFQGPPALLLPLATVTVPSLSV